jgi:hypothetical protein
VCLLQAVAVDPQGLCAALAAKEEQVKESAAEVEGLRAKLRHLQNQILRGPGAIARVGWVAGRVHRAVELYGHQKRGATAALAACLYSDACMLVDAA